MSGVAVELRPGCATFFFPWLPLLLTWNDCLARLDLLEGEAAGFFSCTLLTAQA